MNEILLRDYQQDVYDRTQNAFKQGYKSPLIVLPCRSRKILCNESHNTMS